MTIINLIYNAPRSWKPGANTVLYLPFENDLLDYSPNHYTMTQTGTITKATIGYYFSQPSSGESKISSSYTTAQAVGSYPFTANVWCKKDATSGSQHGWIWWNSVYNSSGTNTIYNSSQVRIEGDAPGAISSSWYSIDNADEWTNFGIVEKADQILFYQNGVLKATRNQSRPLSNLALGLLLYADGTGVGQTYSRFIVEKGEWSADDFLKYYNWSKKNYEDKWEDFQEVEYIENTSSGPRIDTGVIPTQNIKSQIKFRNFSVTGDIIYGMGIGDDNSDYRFFNYSSKIYWDISSSRLEGSTCNTNTDYEFELGNNYVKNVGASTNILSGATVASYTGGSSIKLNYGGTPSCNRWYYVKIYDGSTLVRDLVPCYRKGDSVIGMFDKVNNKFYSNSGSGTFTKGPDVN